jgi:hypothetical protein
MAARKTAKLADGGTVEMPSTTQMSPFRRAYDCKPSTDAENRLVVCRGETLTPTVLILEQPLGLDDSFDEIELEEKSFELWVVDIEKVPKKGGGTEDREICQYVFRNVSVVERAWDVERGTQSITLHTYAPVEVERLGDDADD